MSVPETFFSVSEELKLFFICCLIGAGFGGIYDLFRTLRLLFRHTSVITAAEDIIFCLCWGITLSAFASAAALGIFRGFFVLGSILGFILYIFTVGRIVTGIMKKLILLFKQIFSFIFAPLLKCYALIRKKAMVKFVGCSKIFTLGIKKVKMVLPKTHNLLYNKTENKKRKNVKNVAKEKNVK